MRDAHLVVERFFDGAGDLRAAFEAHFATPDRHTREHQVWNYWYVPESYAYLRTDPRSVIPEPLVRRFIDRLNTWAGGTLGLSTRTEPWLSLYVDGCGQTLHNDAGNGQMGYVYSLTRWGTRTFLGGETLLMSPDNYWGTPRIRTPGAGTAYYTKVPARFDQLLVFDDRVIHGVQTVQGTMDPLAGRVVLHGHLRAEAVTLTGPLPPGAALEALTPSLAGVKSACSRYAGRLHGFLTFRLHVGPDGRVGSARRLCDRVLPVSADEGASEPFMREVFELLTEVAFPPAAGPSEVTVPVLVGA
jgi:hypothetical protein